jgi:hypothetical protein
MFETIDKNDFRLFRAKTRDNTVVGVRIRKASTREQELADLEYSRAYNESLFAGLPTRPRMVNKLKEAGQWTSDDDARREEQRASFVLADQKIGECTELLKKLLTVGGKEIDVNDAPQDIKDRHAQLAAERDAHLKARLAAYTQLVAIKTELDSLFAHTADVRAEEAQRDFVLACTTEYVEIAGTEMLKVTGRVFDSVDALKACTDELLLERLVYEHSMFDANMPSEFKYKDEPADAGEASGEAGGTDADASPGATMGDTAPEKVAA